MSEERSKISFKAFCLSGALTVTGIGCAIADTYIHSQNGLVSEYYESERVKPFGTPIAAGNLAELEEVYQKQAQLAQKRAEELGNTNDTDKDSTLALIASGLMLGGGLTVFIATGLQSAEEKELI